jgi:hypothetical protein
VETDDDLVATDVDKRLTNNDWSAAMPTAAGRRGHQAITNPFVDATSVKLS